MKRDILLDGKTGEDGVLLANWSKPREAGSDLDYLVLDGAHVAAKGLVIPGTVAQGLSPRAFLYTDRPAYWPPCTTRGLEAGRRRFLGSCGEIGGGVL